MIGSCLLNTLELWQVDATILLRKIQHFFVQRTSISGAKKITLVPQKNSSAIGGIEPMEHLCTTLNSQYKLTRLHIDGVLVCNQWEWINNNPSLEQPAGNMKLFGLSSPDAFRLVCTATVPRTDSRACQSHRRGRINAGGKVGTDKHEVRPSVAHQSDKPLWRKNRRTIYGRANYTALLETTK